MLLLRHGNKTIANDTVNPLPLNQDTSVEASYLIPELTLTIGHSMGKERAGEEPGGERGNRVLIRYM